jgi:hypothetical protein
VTSNTTPTPTTPTPSPAAGAGPVRLLLDARDSARALSISQKTLWSQTEPRGPIPCIRLGRRVLYSVDALRQFIASASSGSAGAEVAAGGRTRKESEP